MNTDTIFALSSGTGKSGVAVIRISGENLENEFSKMVRLHGFIQPRHSYLTNLMDATDKLIDQCITVYYPAPASFTGEDIIEIHCHGAPAVIEKIFEYLRTRGMRIAEPGEFSRRAFYNNKMDLTEIDGLAALLDARTDKQREFALKSMTGGDSLVYETWRSQMIEISAYAAAIMDYASDDLPENIETKLIDKTKKLYDEITTALTRYAAVRAIQGGFNIVLTGETNVGKSSLFNRLVGSNRAIVSDIPGTTRDVVSATMDIDGYLVNLSDTAGVRESDDTIEKIGIEKTHAEIRDADLIIKVQSAEFEVQMNEIKSNEIIVFNKCDIIDKTALCTLHSALCVSALTGDGMDALLNVIKKKMHEMIDGAQSDISVNERTRGLLDIAQNELGLAINLTCHESQITNHDIFAEHVRAASDAIGKILGVISIAEVMDATFNQLCLGK